MKRQVIDLLILSILISGCAKDEMDINRSATFYNECKAKKPSWVYDDFVGISKITASGNKSEQKEIALKRAIALMLLTKGRADGSSEIYIKREWKRYNENELYIKKFKESGLIKIDLIDRNFDVKITNMWEDPCTNELYLKIEER